MVRTIAVQYDLNRPGQNYPRLFEYLKSTGWWAKPLKSMWLVKTSKTAAQVRDEIKSYVDSNDEVVVIDVTGAPWATNFSDSSTKWMLENMPVRVAA